MAHTKQRLTTLRRFIFYNLLRLLSFMIKKDPGLWVFGAQGGQKFGGNPKYLFLYLTRNHSGEIRPVWLTQHKAVVNEVRSLGGTAYPFYSWQAIWLGLRAKVYIFSHGLTDIEHYAIRGSKLINLWHGMPVKDISRYNDLYNEKFSTLRLLKIKWIQKLTAFDPQGRYDLLIATSALTAEKLKRAFKNPPKTIAVTGEPKNDIFYEVNREQILLQYGLRKLENKIIITYMPTFRDKRPADLSAIPFWEDLKSEKERVQIMLQWHPSDTLKPLFSTHTPDYVTRVNELGMDVQDLLAVTDILITDYSSCFIDFLLLNRPIIFYPYDYDAYLNYRGFLYDYEHIAPGTISRTRKELIRAIRSNMERPEREAQRRERVTKQFHLHRNGNFSEKVYRAIQSVLVKE